MKLLKNLSATFAIAAVVLMSSCSNDDDTINAPNHAAVELGTSGNYVILAKTSIANTPTSAITGDM